MTEFNMEVLRQRAVAVVTSAYAPYSQFGVGAAAITSRGDVITAVNVENVSYGLGICAEVALVAVGVSSGVLGTADSALVAVSVVDSDGRQLTPCGRCRQVLREFADDSLAIDGAERTWTLGELLPDAFGPEHLARVRDAATGDGN